jgi:hypothetical protein
MTSDKGDTKNVLIAIWVTKKSTFSSTTPNFVKAVSDALSFKEHNSGKDFWKKNHIP